MPAGRARLPCAPGACRHPCRWRRASSPWPDPVPAPHSPCSRSEEHTSELQSLMRISYAVFCLKKKKKNINIKQEHIETHSRIKTEETYYHKTQNMSIYKCIRYNIVLT